MQVFLCRDINICYHVSTFPLFFYSIERIPEGGFINIGNKSNDEISTFITSCKNKQTPVVGLSVYPSQYTTICKTLKGYSFLLYCKVEIRIIVFCLLLETVLKTLLLCQLLQ